MFHNGTSKISRLIVLHLMIRYYGEKGVKTEMKKRVNDTDLTKVSGGTNEDLPPLPYIDPEVCSGCGRCYDICGEDCIEALGDDRFFIHVENCSQCGKCDAVCMWCAIINDFDIWHDVPGHY